MARMRLLLFCLLSWQTSLAAILSIDYGTEWTKAALVKPGIPLEIVLTKDTKRKEQSVIAFKGEERLYGGDAANLASRFPQHTYPGLKSLLGQAIDSPAAQEYSALYPAVKMVQTEQGSIAFEHGSDTFTIEELVAMEFINMRKNAELMADGGVRDAILTVAPHFDHKQRAALIASAQLANLRPIELLNDGLAVAIDYAKSRTFESPQIHAIFDMGAGSTSTTIIQLSSKSIKDVGRFNKTVTVIEVLGTASTIEVSGNVMSERLYKYLVNTFSASCDAKAAATFSKNHRAHARLLKEATRVKQILSANNEAVASVESLHDDVDFKHKITRTIFEELSSDLGPKTSEVVTSALAKAGISGVGLQSLILHGGAARVPFVQKALLDVVSESQLARNVNADEAAVMGSVFRGAGLSGSFRVKELTITDHSTLRYSYATDSEAGTLFEPSTLYGSQRNISFSSLTSDFDLNVLLGDDNPRAIAKYSLTGVSDASAELVKSYGCKAPEIMVTSSLDYSGMVSISAAAAVCEVGDRPGVADKLKGWFGSKESSNEESEKNSKQANATDTDQASAKMSLKSLPLKVTAHDAPFVLSATQVQQSMDKIAKFEQYDNDRIARETARNGLEAFIYKVRDYLESETFGKFSTSGEREELHSLSTKATTWMNELGDTASLADLVAYKKPMNVLTDQVMLRRDEARDRPGKIEALQKQIASSRAFIKSQMKQIGDYKLKKEERTKNTKSAVSPQTEDVLADDDSESAEASLADVPEEEELLAPLYTEAEMNVLTGKLDTAEEWLNEQTNEQDKLKITDNPTLLTAELDRRTSKITDDFMYLIRKVTYAEQSKSKTKAKSKTKSKAKPKAQATKDPAKSDSSSKEEPAIEDDATSNIIPKDAAADATEGDLPEPKTDDLHERAADPQPEDIPDLDPKARDEL